MAVTTATCAVCAEEFSFTVAPGRRRVTCGPACKHERRNAGARNRRAAEIELLTLARAIRAAG